MACENTDISAVHLSQTEAEAAIFCLINEKRVENNLQPLTLNSILRGVARDQALAAATIRWWPNTGGDIGDIPHVNPVTGKNEQQRIEDAGYCPIAPSTVPRNENAYAHWFTGTPTGPDGTTPQEAVDWWMQSPPHRDTLLNPLYRETGVGIVRGVASQGLPADADGAIFYQCFGGCSEIEPAVDTQLWAWGGNQNGQLGTGGSQFPSKAPVHPAEFEDFVAVAASGHSVAVKADGTVWSWGPREEKGSDPGGSTVPEKVPNIEQVTTVAAGYEHNLAIKNDGTLWAWGDNRWGQLGDNSGQDQETPVQVRNLRGVKAIAAGHSHSLALLQDGSVWAWGNNGVGQLGLPVGPPPSAPGHPAPPAPDPNHPLPERVPLSGRIIAIAAGDYHSLAIEEGNGQLWIWGWNLAGCLGIGSLPTTDIHTQWRDIPAKPVPGGAFTGQNIVAIGGGASSSIALAGNGQVYAWGDNTFGLFGTGSDPTLQSPTPVHVRGLPVVAGLSAGSFHYHAHDRNGSLWSWGNNAAGQLGTGTTPVTGPTKVAAIDHVASYSAGYNHSLAIAHQDK
jgi:alpha-tubulin suppressor-like RCC1 family protein/uncharacterized protein YkwD